MAEYENPVIRGFNPDPSIIRIDENYFLVTSSFEYFPGLPIYHSKDLTNWNLIGHAITRTSQLRIATPEPGGGLWAPTIRHHDGVYYVLCASFERYRPQADDRVWPQGFYVQTSNIWDSESWSDPVYFDQIGFDHDIFWDDDGTAYISSTYRKSPRTITMPSHQLKDFAVHVSTVDVRTGNSLSKPVCIRWSSSGVAEGSHLLKRGNYYYLFTAEGGTESGHSEWVSRSSVSPFGPWEVGPQNPLWRNTVEDEVQNTGHADLVEDPQGKWWAVLLAVRPIKSEQGGYHPSVFGRETFLVPVTWTEDDWPVFNHGRKITLLSQGHSGKLQQNLQVQAWVDHFNGPSLSLGWYRKNTPHKPDYEIGSNKLRIYGNSYSLSSPASPSLLLRKQTLINSRWTTKLSFNPTSPEYEAGTCVYWNYTTWASLGVRQGSKKTRSQERVIKFTFAYSDPETQRQLVKTSSATLEGTGDLVLFIECSSSIYRLGYYELAAGRHLSYEEVATIPENTIRYMDLGQVKTQVMTTDPPVGAAFTGMMQGVYAFGVNQKCLDPADFHFVRVDCTRDS